MFFFIFLPKSYAKSGVAETMKYLNFARLTMKFHDRHKANIQLWKMNDIPLVNKPYVKEVTLTKKDLY